MNITCPSCRSAIPDDDINVSTDLALCRNCGKTFSFSQIVEQRSDTGPDLSNPPSGASFENLPDGFRIQASARTWMALFYIPFTCFWSGMSLNGLYGTQIRSGEFDLVSSLFGLPFLIGSVVLISVCVMSSMGKIELTRTGDSLRLFMGVGPLGWSRSFLWSDFNLVREDSGRWNRGTQTSIVLEGKRRVAFGSLLKDERRYFVLNALRKMLRESRMNSSSSIKPLLS